MKTKSKLWILAIVAVIAVVVVVGGVKFLQIRKMIDAGKSFAPPPESVTSAEVKELEWQGSREAVGTLVAVRAVMVGAEVGGLVREVAFESGGGVKKGALLVKLDTSAEEAQLAASEADAALAREQLNRARALRKGGANTPADLDAAEARAKQATATLKTLQVNIDKKTIRAPFDGRVAIRQVELGQVLAPGSTIASLQSVSPIHADFWLPQQALATLKVGQKARLHVDTFPGKVWEGKVTTINPEVDVATRNVKVRATFPNEDGRLRPGMFARVEVLSGQTRKVLAVPITAVIFAPYGDSVFVLTEKRDAPSSSAAQQEKGTPGTAQAAEGATQPGKGAEAPAAGKPGQGGPVLVAQQKFVRLGERRGDFVEVVSGLTVGETVVGNGAFKLRSGASVVVRNDLAPPTSLTPNPETP